MDLLVLTTDTSSGLPSTFTADKALTLVSAVVTTESTAVATLSVNGVPIVYIPASGFPAGMPTVALQGLKIPLLAGAVLTVSGSQTAAHLIFA